MECFLYLYLRKKKKTDFDEDGVTFKHEKKEFKNTKKKIKYISTKQV